MTQVDKLLSASQEYVDRAYEERNLLEEDGSAPITEDGLDVLSNAIHTAEKYAEGEVTKDELLPSFRRASGKVKKSLRSSTSEGNINPEYENIVHYTTGGFILGIQAADMSAPEGENPQDDLVDLGVPMGTYIGAMQETRE